MAQDVDKEVRELLEAEGPNEPLRMPGNGLSGPRQPVSPALARQRRQAMAAAMVQGASRDAIMQAFTDPNGAFKLSEQQVLELMVDVRHSWAEEDLENQSHLRAASTRRLLGHIRKAADAGRWAAVAALEKVHADVSGTSVPEPPADTDQRIQEAVIAVLEEISPDELRGLISRRRKVIDVEGVEVARVPAPVGG